MFHGKTDKITERFGLEDRSIPFGLGPTAVLVISKDHNSGLGMDRKQTSIPLDGEDTHGRNSPGGSFLTECTIFAQREPLVGAHVFDAGLLLVVTL